jgi:hypothetical protein
MPLVPGDLIRLGKVQVLFERIHPDDFRQL